MTPQEKFKPQFCFALPQVVFDLLFSQLHVQHRWIDPDLAAAGYDNFLLIKRWPSRQACFYVESKTIPVQPASNTGSDSVSPDHWASPKNIR